MRKRTDTSSRPLWHDVVLAAVPPLASAAGEAFKEWVASRRKSDGKAGV